MIGKEMEGFEELSNVRIGPSPEWRRSEDAKAQAREVDRVYRLIQEKREQESALKDRYGEDLADAAIAYSSRVGISNGFVSYRGKQVEVDTVRPLFATELAKGLTAQPEEQQAEWVDSLFKAMDQLHSPYRY